MRTADKHKKNRNRLTAIISLLAIAPSAVMAQAHELEARISEMLTTIPAEVGVAVITSNGDTVKINNSTQYPLMSVMKFHQAIAVADRIAQQSIGTDGIININKDDLKPDTWSPMRDNNPDIRQASIGKLLEFTLQQSDNNACDILFKNIVSPTETDSIIRSWAISDCKISVTENDMHLNTAKANENSATPLSCVKLLEEFYRKRNTTPQLEYVWQTMANCKTGTDRLPYPLPDNKVTIIHKTGTGFTDKHGNPTGINDIGLIILPDGRHYSIAVMIKTSELDMKNTSKIIAEISDITYKFHTNTNDK